MAVTVLKDRNPGDKVNLETDIIGKYVEKLLFAGPAAPRAEPRREGGITKAFLTRYGF